MLAGDQIIQFTIFVCNFVKLTAILIYFAGGVIMFGAFLLFEEDFIHVVTITFTSLILTELLMVALTVRTWHYLMVVAEFLSFGLYVASLAVLRNFFGRYNSPSNMK